MNIEITVKSNDEKILLDLKDTSTIDTLYRKFELIALFLGYSKKLIDDTVTIKNI